VFLRVPQFVLGLLLGEMAAMLTHGPRIVPRRLQEAGYLFRFATLDAALRDLA
jgi:NAD dependent epimerase/dehydratase family enzyme